MKKVLFVLLTLSVFGVGLCGCKARTANGNSHGNSVITPAVGVKMPGTVRPGAIGQKGQYPMAHIYRMNGDWSNLVPIGMRGSELVSFPGPADLTAASRPIRLADGYWLDSRGVGAGTAFTRYTYDEYMALPAPPDKQTLLNAIVPGARVTTVVELPFPIQTARADTAAVNALIREGLPGCITLYP